MKRSAWLALALVMLLTAGCKRDSGKLTIAYVTNGIDPFWTIAEKGATDAAAKFDINLKVIMPPGGMDDQKRMVEDLLARGVQGVAISPINPEAQGDLLKEIADRTKGNLI